MGLIINPKLFDLFPELNIGVVIARNIKDADTLTVLREEEKSIRSKEPVLMDLPDMKNWRLAYKTLGVKKGVRVSVESLVKRVIKGNELPHINGLVDLYNGLSLKHIFPFGGEDLNSIEGDIHLTFADGTENFMQIGSDENEPPEVDEVVYKDQLGCLCRRFNWREADRTKLTETTKNAILVVESISNDRIDDLKNAVDDLARHLEKHLNCTTEMKILNKETTTYDF